MHQVISQSSYCKQTTPPPWASCSSCVSRAAHRALLLHIQFQLQFSFSQFQLQKEYVQLQKPHTGAKGLLGILLGGGGGSPRSATKLRLRVTNLGMTLVLFLNDAQLRTGEVHSLTGSNWQNKFSQACK